MTARIRRLLATASLVMAATPLVGQGPALDRTPSRFAPYAGIRVHYKSLGLGSTAVVFVHGWASDLTFWRAQAPAVDGRVRAIFVDLPGFGRSDKPDVTYSMDYFAGAVDAVLQAAGVQRAVLVGHSMGTPVIRQYYRRYPAKVVALVVVDGALRNYFKDSVEARSFVAGFEGRDYAANLQKSLDGMIGPGDSLLHAGILRVALGTPQRVLVSAMREMTLNPAVWRDDPIEVPLLAVMAGGSNWAPEYAAYVKRLAPGARYETVAGAGHFLMMDHPEAFNALLLDFLRARQVVR